MELLEFLVHMCPTSVEHAPEIEYLSHRGLIGFTCTQNLNYKDEKGAKHTISFLLLQILYLAKPTL